MGLEVDEQNLEGVSHAYENSADASGVFVALNENYRRLHSETL